MFGGDGTQYVDVGLGNPYATGYSFQMGNAALLEPLYFYSAYSNEEIPWLATGYEYNDDFTELTVNIREGVEWSDGEAFDANDVVFTINMLKENAPLLKFSSAIDSAVEKVEAVDDLTVHITFKEPRPRFMLLPPDVQVRHRYLVCAGAYLQGCRGCSRRLASTILKRAGQWRPGPTRSSSGRPQQKFLDRRDDWWGVKAGFMDKLPAPERLLFIPRSTDDTALIQRVVNNEVDQTLDLRANTITQTFQNPNIITHTGTEPPYGYMDWWPTSLWFNHEEGPFTEADVRWAVSYSIDREQLLDVGLDGSGIITPLPFPQFPAMQPYFDAAEDLLAKYPTNEFNPEKAAALMEGQGYEKDERGLLGQGW